ncbi:MAG: hypothetical protein QM757_04050 [Paludibaculum sp.]
MLRLQGLLIKEYFANYFLHMSDVTFDMAHNRMQVHRRSAEPWKVTLVDTGEETMTGGRLKRVRDYVRGRESFCFTYGDGVATSISRRSIEFHRQHGKKATVTAVRPPGRYGALKLERQLRSPASWRSLAATAASSMAASSCCRRNASTSSKVTDSLGITNQWRTLPPTAS